MAVSLSRACYPTMGLKYFLRSPLNSLKLSIIGIYSLNCQQKQYQIPIKSVDFSVHFRDKIQVRIQRTFGPIVLKIKKVMLLQKEF